MKKQWNKGMLKRRYDLIVEQAKEKDNFTDEELSTPYLDKLSHKTKSPRIIRMIILAYTLGRMRAIQDIDDGFNEVTLS